MTATDRAVDTPDIAASRYLDDLTAAVRSKSISWEDYQRASVISEDELLQIHEFEKLPETERGKYLQLFLRLLQKIVRNDTVQGILVLIDDILEGHQDELEESSKAPGAVAELSPAFVPLLRLLKKDDEFIQLKTAKIITFVLVEINPGLIPPADLTGWIATQLQSENPSIVDITVQLLQSLLSVLEFRTLFYNTPSAVTSLLEILKKANNAQLQYQIIYCLWLLTFGEQIAADLQRKYDVIPICVEIAKSAIKEKVVRVVLATFRNMLTKALTANVVFMITNKILNLCDNLSARKWSDPEISEDLEYLKDEISKNVQNLSTFDVYVSEVISGKLDWSPPHLSENFWKVNVGRFNDKDYELLRILSTLIGTSESPVVLAVAAHDFGQYVKYYPNGKKVLSEIGAKTQIMMLMTHADADVRYQALMAVQKLLVGSWDA